MNLRLWWIAAGLGLFASFSNAADVSRDEFLKEAHEHAATLFDKLDANKDGVLTQAERDAKRKQVVKDSEMNPPRLHGDISREEYFTKADTLAGKVFDHADRDHNGVLSDAERKRARDTFRTRLQQHRMDADVGAA
ncbi:hypothetical protein [Chitinolyticbacter meiyuanensis]|uniref:hypothetical protein n=1 Tax=Chitinolyticbacter meiyuanensis TaxID=682798 RepID=UPI0011E5BD4D|nr:hypothetical protein [Chitinolyticbacter meiyuanensis]